MRICIDPGHGGSDPGAIGPNKTEEKSHALAVSFYLRDFLYQAGHDVFMTREHDTDVSYPGATANEELQARVDVSNKEKADIFVSIHCNATENEEAYGTETYHIDGSAGGSMLAQYVHSELVAIGLTNRGTKTANFYVIKYTKMPAILVELEFISNLVGEKYLSSDEGQRELAEAIYQGIKHYFEVFYHD